MSDEVVVANSMAQELEMVEEAGTLHLRGYNYTNISEILSISVYRAKKYVGDYIGIIKQESDSDPYFLERVQENTVKFLRELDDISKEAWETCQVATDNGMVTARVQALKLILEVTGKKAQLYQLMGGRSADSDYIARMQKSEHVNQILSAILTDVVSECDHCREQTRMRLAEAFSLMEVEDAEEVSEEAETA